ncbi:hypothetical protein F4781DRAFT_292442 [Annulohypoxylon bovei var. microspora]|nr:hypothetical protein F4781DRAFT_292442 [Annulohypoxylon bovei var. microspora]
MMVYPVLDRKAALNRLYSENNQLFQDEENLHPWRVLYSRLFQDPLLRIWDNNSGSRPAKDNRMMSRAPEMRLDNAKSRKASLTKHLDYSKWTDGPYISFTTCPVAIKELAKMRLDRERGAQTLSVIDPKSRIMNGLPILNVATEMDHYSIPDPYDKGKEYYTNHCVCLWQVTETEIVGHWDWDSLANSENWYENIIIPAVDKWRENNQLEFHKLAVKGTEEKGGGLDNYYFQQHVSDDEDFDCTYDGMVEANTSDNIIRMIEGDWNY